MRFSKNQAILVADLGYGDAGKGSVVDYLVRKTGAHTVVRYNGGAQAAHNVITPGGLHHTFAQFGSGTFIPGTRTHLSRFMMVHPLSMLAEERHLQSLGVHDAFSRLSIERHALVTTPFHQSINRLKELRRGGARHGSCGLGIGETMSDWLAHGDRVLFARDLLDRERLEKKLEFIRDAKLAEMEKLLQDLPHDGAVLEELIPFSDPGFIQATADMYEYFASRVHIVDETFLGDILRQGGTTIFEGAQGILLDEWYGFFPYNTWSTVTYKNADTLLAENNFSGSSLRLGLVRAYATRHGAGPFVTEDPSLSVQLRDLHNTDNAWQHEFRIGYLDLVALRYALSVTGPIDGLAITSLDRMEGLPEWKVCDRYQASPGGGDMGTYFDIQGQTITGIKVPRDPTDLSRQGHLTSLLSTVQPVYQAPARDLGAYLERISKALHMPVLMTSFGPTALQKSSSSSLPGRGNENLLDSLNFISARENRAIPALSSFQVQG
jgi:adenylosuccinate synthase